MTFQSRQLKQTASENLQKAKNQREILLLYAAGMLGLSCLNLVIQALVSNGISQTGGLIHMGNRSFLSAVSTFLPVLCSIGNLCLGFGYLGGMLRISRGQYASRNALRTGFERFWPLVRMKLLLGLVYLGAGIGASYLSAVIFLLSPFSAGFEEQLAPLISGSSLLTGSTDLVLDDATLSALSTAAIPLLLIFLVVALALVVPLLYRYRMADFVLLDHPESGAMYALRESRKMMRGSRFGLFRLDLSFWWYYLLSVLVSALAYGDVLLALLGVSLPMSETAASFLFYFLYLAADFALLYCFYNKLNVTYALAYNQVKPKEETGGAVLGNIFQM